MSIDAPLGRRQFTAGVAALVAIGTLPAFPRRIAAPAHTGDVTNTSEAIHQEVSIPATRHRIFEALMDAAQFAAVTRLGDAPGGAPASISREPGGAFSVFDGHIFGRQLELVPDERIVQAWRVADWPAGIWSIARYQLRESAGTTTIVFDHTGFPSGLGEHLADGWRTHYWEPIRKYLS